MVRKESPHQTHGIAKKAVVMNIPAPASAVPEILKHHQTIGETDSFTFECRFGLPCFCTCCRDVNIFLTPLDVLTLARRTGLDTTVFLQEHTLLPVTKDLHLPVVLLKMNADAEKKCPFVSASGCTVYEDRPWACRMYPLGTAVPPARAGETPAALYFLMKDAFCRGTAQPVTQRVDVYRAEQGVPYRESIEAGFQRIVSHPWFIGGRQLDPKRIEMFHLAAYNLDGFRRFVFDTTFLDRFEIDEAEADTWRIDDIALLKFGFEWLRFALFGEPVVKVSQVSDK
jgi:hypothetical protein